MDRSAMVRMKIDLVQQSLYSCVQRRIDTYIKKMLALLKTL